MYVTGDGGDDDDDDGGGGGALFDRVFVCTPLHSMLEHVFLMNYWML